MKTIPNEEIIAHHNEVILTNFAVIKEERTLFGNLNYTEIPIKRINSLSREHVFKKRFLIIGLIAIILGGFYFEDISNLSNITYVRFSPFIIGTLFFLLFIITGKKNLVIRAGEAEIKEDTNGAGEFVDKLRKRIYESKV